MVEHLHGCPREREETFTWHGSTVTRCLDCGEQVVIHRDTEPPSDHGVRFEPMPTPAFREVHLYE
jgi:hypothetical protein